MPSDSKPEESAPGAPPKKPQDFASQPALALELPFTFVGAIVVGGAIGFFLDRWLRTSQPAVQKETEDRKSTRLNSSHLVISYAVFCLKKKKTAALAETADLSACY